MYELFKISQVLNNLFIVNKTELKSLYYIILIDLCIDFEVCEKWITRAKKLQSRDKNVLKNRNAFVKYLVGLIRETLELTGDSPSCCLWGVSIILG